MLDLDSFRQALQVCQNRFDDEICPAIDAADEAVQEYGFNSYSEMMATMMQLSKTIVATCKKIKEVSAIEDEIEEMDELLKLCEPIVNEMLPTVQNVLVETLPSEAFEDIEYDKGMEGLVKFIMI